MVTRHESIQDIDPRDWDRLAHDNGFATHGWLLTLETCSRANARPLYVVQRRNGCAVAATVCYEVSHSPTAETLDHVVFGRAVSGARAAGLSLLPALVCGPLLGYGWHIGVHPDLSEAEAQHARGDVLDAIEAAAAERGLDLGFAHVTDSERPLRQALEDRRYLRCRNVPIARLDLGWESFDAYLDHLPKKTRAEFKRQINRHLESGTAIVQADLPIEQEQRLLKLFDDNAWDHGRLLFLLGPRGLVRLKELMKDRAKIFVASNRDAVTGVCLVIEQGLTAFTVAVGVDPRLTADDYTYFHLTYNSTIAEAIASRMRHLYFGRGLYELKLRRGCTLENTWTYTQAAGVRRLTTRAWFHLASFWNHHKLPSRAQQMLAGRAQPE